MIAEPTFSGHSVYRDHGVSKIPALLHMTDLHTWYGMNCCTIVNIADPIMFLLHIF